MKALAALIFLALAVPAQADGFIDNVAGSTRDAQGRIVQFGGLLIAADGRVSRLVAPGEKPPRTVKLDYRLDGKERTLVTGRISPGIALMDEAIAALVREPLMRARPLQPYERDLAFSRFQQRMLDEGITTVVDLDTEVADWEVYRRAADAGRLRIRVLCYAAGLETLMLVAGNQPTPWLHDGHVRMAGLAIIDAPPFDDARIRNLISRGAMDGFQVALIPHGDGAIDHALAAIEEVAASYGHDRRWRLETGSAPLPDSTRLARSGTIAIGNAPADPADAAFAAGVSDRLGMLMPGMQADFLLLDTQGGKPDVWIGGIRVQGNR